MLAQKRYKLLPSSHSFLFFFCVLACIFLITPVGAQQTPSMASSGASSTMPQEVEKNFDGNFSFGYVGTSGNTDTTTVNGELQLEIRHGSWVHKPKFQSLAAQENEETKAERFYIENKTDFNVNDDTFVFGKISYTDDRFSGFEFQSALSAGYGRHLLMQPGAELQIFAGGGVRYNNVIDAGTEAEIIFSLGQDLNWTVSSSTKLVQSLAIDVGTDLTITRLDIALESNIIGQIATRIAFQVRNTSNVPLGRAVTDTQTSVSVVYSF